MRTLLSTPCKNITKKIHCTVKQNSIPSSCPTYSEHLHFDFELGYMNTVTAKLKTLHCYHCFNPLPSNINVSLELSFIGRAQCLHCKIRSPNS